MQGNPQSMHNTLRLMQNRPPSSPDVLRLMHDVVQLIQDLLRTLQNVLRLMQDILQSMQNVLQTIQDVLHLIHYTLQSMQDIVRTLQDVVQPLQDLQRKINYIHRRLRVEEAQRGSIRLSRKRGKEETTEASLHHLRASAFQRLLHKIVNISRGRKASLTSPTSVPITRSKFRNAHDFFLPAGRQPPDQTRAQFPRAGHHAFRRWRQRLLLATHIDRRFQ